MMRTTLFLLNCWKTIRQLYKKTARFRMMREAITLDAYRQRSILAIASLGFMISSVATAADYEYPKGAGFIPLGSADGTVTVPSGTRGNPMTTSASAFNLRPETTNNTAYNCYGGALPTTINGYTGFQIAQGILLVAYSGTATGTVHQVSGTTTVTGKWDETGKYSSDPSNTLALWCGNSAKTDEFISSQIGSKASITIKWGLYIGPTAVTGLYQVPPLYLIKAAGSYTTLGATQLVPGSTLSIGVTTCTISAPATVPFGNVTGKQAYIVPQSMSLKCSGGNDAANVSYQVTSKSGTGTSTTIPMNNTASGNQVGEVRGFLWNAGATDAGCLDKASSMKMDGSSNTLRAGLAQNTALAIPVNWVLCPATDAEPGPATAALAFNITW